MTEQNNLPENEDTKTKVTAKVTAGIPGKSVPGIDLEKKAAAPVPVAAPATAAAPAPASNTMTGRTMKLQGLANLGGATPAVAPAPAAASAPAAPAPAPAEDDTRTRRTIKLSSLASAPAVKPLATPAAPAKAAADSSASSTVTRRTQKLEALDTQAVEAINAADANAAAGNAAKISAVAASPAPQDMPAASKPRQTVKVEGIAPVHAPAVIEVNAAADDTTTRKTSKVEEVPEGPATINLSTAPNTVEISGAALAGQAPAKVAAAPVIPKVSVKPAAPAPAPAAAPAPAPAAAPAPAPAVAPAGDAPKFKAGNVDDTVKLQRPAPKPTIAGSVAPAAQTGTSAAGGIKLNKAAAPKPAKPKAVVEKVEDDKPVEEAKAPEEKAAEPAGNLGKNQEPPKKKKGLKVNTDAIKDLGSSPAAQNPAVTGGGTEGGKGASGGSRRESTGINVTFAVFVTLAAVVMIFVALVAVTDYFNIWQPGDSRIDLPIISEHVYSNIKK